MNTNKVRLEIKKLKSKECSFFEIFKCTTLMYLVVIFSVINFAPGYINADEQGEKERKLSNSSKVKSAVFLRYLNVQLLCIW